MFVLDCSNLTFPWSLQCRFCGDVDRSCRTFGFDGRFVLAGARFPQDGDLFQFIERVPNITTEPPGYFFGSTGLLSTFPLLSFPLLIDPSFLRCIRAASLDASFFLKY